MKYVSGMLGIVLVCIVFVALFSMRGASAQMAAASASPPGIPAADWLPLNANLGFVVQRIVPSSTRTLSGFFMAKRGGGWWRLQVTQPHVALMRAAEPRAQYRSRL